MKQFTTKIASFSLALAVLFTTSSFAVDAHFCCNRLVDVSIFSKAQACTDYAEIASSKQCTLEAESCCIYKTFVKIGENDLQKVTVDFNLEPYTSLNTFHDTYINLFEGLEAQIVPFSEHVPPLISKNILILHSTFLI